MWCFPLGIITAVCTKTFPSIFCSSDGCMVPLMGTGREKTIRDGMKPILHPHHQFWYQSHSEGGEENTLSKIQGTGRGCKPLILPGTSKLWSPSFTACFAFQEQIGKRKHSFWLAIPLWVSLQSVLGRKHREINCFLQGCNKLLVSICWKEDLYTLSELV